MTDQRRVVFGERAATDRVPEWANGGAVIIEWIQQRGLWDEACQRLKVQREGGYAGIDAFLFLLYYFGSGLKIGVKEFSDRAREHQGRLAAIGGRLRLPTQASMSRLLAAVESDRAHEFGSWLLRDLPNVKMVLSHPSVLTRDAVGEAWHVFDWDPTVTTLRHRALPVFDGMPDGRRRSESMAKPGYPGRKRGDVQFSRATLQHAGSGLWLGIDMAPGNGNLRGAFQGAIRQVVETCGHADIALERAILRADGVAGNVPFITACVEAGVHYITRLAHYQLLEDDKVVRHLNHADWFEVPSSGSGPTRQAADLGRVFLEPAEPGPTSDGRVYGAIETRVVVSRFANSGEARGAGVVLNGWQYELYATDLAAVGWPEAEIVTGYYGRSGQENRFMQEDRELGLDRIFSYHPAGQQLASLVGLFVWNFSICRGLEIERPPEDLPDQPVADCALVVETPLLRGGPPVETTSSDRTVEDASNAVSDAAAASAGAKSSAGNDLSGPTKVPPCPSEVSESSPGDTASQPTSAGDVAPPRDRPTQQRTCRAIDLTETTRRRVIEALDAIDWDRVLHKHVGWQWRAPEGGLQCPAKAVLPLLRMERVNSHKDRQVRARFQADWGVCDSCKLRTSCFRSDDPCYRKDVRLPMPSSHAEPLYALWLSVAQRSPTRRHAAPPSSAPGRPIWRLKPLSWEPPGQPIARAELAVSPPTLLPAELRKLTRRLARCVELHVDVKLPPTRPSRSPTLAYSPAERQKRRLTWRERLRWNQMPADARIELRFLGPSAVQQLIVTTIDGPQCCRSRES